MENINNYINYQSMITSVATGLKQVSGVCNHVSMNAHVESLNQLQKKLSNHTFSVGIMGEFRRGKSTVINALLGQAIVPSDIVPCTATLNYIKWGTTKRGVVIFRDGSKKEVSIDELSNYITKITVEAEKMAETVKDAVVYYPCPFCQNGVQIIDTPGLNDNEMMTAISENVIPTVDAIIMVLVPDSPFSMTEADFVRNKVMTSDLGRIIFVVNKIDIIDEDDRPRLLNSIKEKIKSSVLQKTIDIYGEDSEEYKSTIEKIGDIRLYPVSAIKALKGKLNNDLKMIEESGYNEFENALSILLTEERGMLELIHPINQLLSKSKEVVENINTRYNALDIHADEFEKIQLESIEKIESTREQKKLEIETLKSKGNTLYNELLPKAEKIYDSIEEALKQDVEKIDFSGINPDNKAQVQGLCDKLNKQISSTVENTVNIHTERLYGEICTRLGTDVQSMEKINTDIFDTIGGIHGSIIKKSGNAATMNDIRKDLLFDVGGLIASSFVGVPIPGLGGLIAGYQAHGWGGALAGGLSGAAAGIATMLLLATPLGFSVPLLLASGLASTFGGKAVVSLIFGRKNPNKVVNNIKAELTKAVDSVAKDMRDSRSVEIWLKETCDSTYGRIADDIDNEWENTLSSMEAMLTQIKIDIEMNAANKEKMQKQFKGYIDEIEQVIADITPIKEKIVNALNK